MLVVLLSQCLIYMRFGRKGPAKDLTTYIPPASEREAEACVRVCLERLCKRGPGCNRAACEIAGSCIDAALLSEANAQPEVSWLPGVQNARVEGRDLQESIDYSY